MTIAFLTKEKLSFDEAPPSRMLNLKRILEQHIPVYIICQKSAFKEKNTIQIPKVGENFFAKQAYKIIVLITALWLLIRKKVNHFIVREYYYVPLLYPFVKLFGAKILYDMHCFRYKELRTEHKLIKSILIFPFEKMAHIFADKILVISDGILEDLSTPLRKKSLMLQNGVNMSDFGDKIDRQAILRKHGISGRKIVGFVGNWMGWVDVSTFLKTSSLVKDATFVVVGEGYDKSVLADLKKAYPNVVFTGRISHKQVTQLLSAMDVCVMPYKKEEVVKHLSVRKLFEYLAAGKPIVMSKVNITSISELEEGKHMLYCKPESSQDFASKIKKLLSNRKLAKKLAENNKKLAKKFSWDVRVKQSGILPYFGVFIPGKKESGSVSIIIKAYNEERHIERCIQSALKALQGLQGEVLLVDSKSSDRTIELAKKYPIRIVQIKKANERRCGIGPQIGYLCSKGEFIYILDGDMVLDKSFISKALPYLDDPHVAGVGGNIKEKSKHAFAFQARSKYHHVKKGTAMQQLGMGGLYKREAIDDIGYFSNPYFYAYEEYDLAAKLMRKSYFLVRLPIAMVDHFGDRIDDFHLFIKRWKSKYLLGSGQYLKRAFLDDHFLKTLKELWIYVFTLFWYGLGVVVLLSAKWTLIPLATYFVLSVCALLLLLTKKKSFKRLLFSLLSWSFQSLGMALGFLIPSKPASQFKPKVVVVK